MSVLFFIYIIALLFSFFVVGAVLGALFTRTPTGKTVLATVRKRLRVLMFGWEFPPFNSGGLGVACLGITKALSDKDVDVVFVMPKRLPDAVPFAKMISADIDNATVDMKRFDIKYAFNSPVLPYDSSKTFTRREDALLYEDGTPVYGSDIISEARRYARFGAAIAKKEPHDFVYAHDWLAFGAGAEAKQVSGKPFIAHIHSTEFDRTGDNPDPRIAQMEYDGLHRADRVVAVSERTKHAVTSRYAVPADKVHVVHNGIDETTAPAAGITTIRLSALKKAGYKLVLFLGRITIQKGPDYFIRAARRVIDHDPDVLFIMAGSGDMEHQMMHLAASMGIADKILFPGFLRGADQYEAYKLADLFVVPSVSEPFGLTVLESMYLGTPVIVSKQSGVAEAVEHALKVDFWDIEKMADLMLSVLESPEFRKELSKKSTAEAAVLTWDKTADGLRAVMDGFATT